MDSLSQRVLRRVLTSLVGILAAIVHNHIRTYLVMMLDTAVHLPMNVIVVASPDHQAEAASGTLAVYSVTGLCLIVDDR